MRIDPALGRHGRHGRPLEPHDRAVKIPCPQPAATHSTTVIDGNPVTRPIKKILVANRGEIAIRILRAASELKLCTVAVYTREERFSPHRYKADEAYQIGKDDEPLKPYLDIESIIKVAAKENAIAACLPVIEDSREPLNALEIARREAEGIG